MKNVFIGWSGNISKEVANILKQWIPTVFLQTNKPFVSFQDIDKGTNWNYELNKVLSDTHFGILCFTKDNLDSIWLHFEAGALLKQFDNTKVCPLFYKVEDKLPGPLSQFQPTKFEKGDICQLIHSINNSCMDPKLDDATLNSQFIRCWPELEEKLKKLETSLPDNFERTPIDRDDKIFSSLKVQNEALIEIAEKINKISFDYPRLLNKFMDDTGVTYRSSIFGTRINHFSNEKKALARKTIEIIQEELTKK